MKTGCKRGSDERLGQLEGHSDGGLNVALEQLRPCAQLHLTPAQAQRDQEEAALTLGANGWQTFFYVTLPNIRWALLYGAILANARVIGEFGAVSVVSGNIRGETMTLPLQVQLLYDDYNVTGAFAAATILAAIAVLTLILRSVIEARHPHGH